MLARIRMSLPVHPTLRHPRTGAFVRALGVVNGKVVWPVMGGAPDDDGGGGGGDDGGGGGGDDAAAKAAAEAAAAGAAAAAKAAEDGDKGFPENTPVAEMTDKQAAAYWKFQSRKHETTAKARGDYDDLKKQAAEAEKLRKERETENEKATREAAEKATAEERARNAPRLVSAEFRAAAKGVLSDEQVASLLEDLDLSKYLTDKGEVDVEKVEKKVKAFAPAGDGKRKFPDLGQGRRSGGTGGKGSAGAAEADRRFAKAGTKTTQ